MTEKDREEYGRLKKQGLGVTAAYFLDRFDVFGSEFKKLGINLSFGSNLPDDLKEEFSPPLLELAQTRKSR